MKKYYKIHVKYQTYITNGVEENAVKSQQQSFQNAYVTITFQFSSMNITVIKNIKNEYVIIQAYTHAPS